MATELVDANTQVQTFDANAIGEIIANRLVPVLQSNLPKEQKVDEINEVVSALRAANVDDADIQAHISTALGLDKKVTRLLKETEDSATKKIFQHIHNKEINTAVSRIVRSYSKEDELIAEVAPSIREKVMNEFFNSTTSAVVSARNKFLNGGELDEDVLDGIAANFVERIEQKRTGKKTAAATATIKPSDTTARPADSPNEGSMKREDMTDRQQLIYDGHKQTLVRSGWSVDEAEKSAQRAALRMKY